MSQTICPNGHTSVDPDWCDTCGARLGAAPAAVPDTGSTPLPAGAPLAAPPSGAPVSSVDAVSCPHCGSSNSADALFCEDCGYDFTTGQSPDPVPTSTVPVVSPAGAAAATPATTSTPATASGVTPTPDTTPGPSGWIVVVEVDRAWYELKGTLADQPCPAPSSSTVPLALSTVHVGRSSQSRGIHPEIALDFDTAVSRRHAQLVALDANTYGAVDLGSTNGTFVLTAGTEPTDAVTPIDPGPPVPLADGDRIYLGAWSRLTIRKAGN